MILSSNQLCFKKYQQQREENRTLKNRVENELIKRVNIDEDNTKKSDYAVYVQITFENNEDNEVNNEDNTEGNTKDNEDNVYIKDGQSNTKYTNRYSQYIFGYFLIVNMIMMQIVILMIILLIFPKS